MLKIKISNDFSETPGGRYKTEGKYSGEEFRDTLLKKMYDDAVSKNEILRIDFDDCYGIGTSFLEEAFGGLVRKYHLREILKHIELVANDDETILINVPKYIRAAEEKLK